MEKQINNIKRIMEEAEDQKARTSRTTITE